MMTNYDDLIEKLDIALSSNNPESFSESLGTDVGVINDLLGTFDTTLDDGQTDYKKGLKVVATKYFPEEFCHHEYVACGADDKATKSRMVKLKTRLYYKQLKFNLLREESEGYAKVISELFSGDKYNDPLRTLSRLQKLIGQFNLDPNRVVDILLDCFEANSDRASFYTGILAALKVSREDLADILKRKFIFQEKLDGNAYSLCNLAAIICEQGLVDLLPFFAFLEPDQKALIEVSRKHNELTKTRAKKAEVIITSAAAIDDIEIEEEPKNVTSLPFYVALDSQLSEDAKICGDSYNDTINLSKNLKLGFICALLERGAWKSAMKLLDKFPQFSAVSISPKIQLAIAKLIAHSISHLYKTQFGDEILSSASSNNNNGAYYSDEPVQTWTEFVEITIPMINQLGPFIAVDPIAAFKLLRIVTVFFKNMEVNSELKNLEVPMVDIVDNCILPALSLLDSSYSYSDELWELLGLFSYQQRFRLYSHWKYVHTPRFLEVQRAMVLGRTKYCIKRLSKDSVKPIGRMLGKLCHIHPFAVFEYLLDQVQVFQNFITPVVDSLRFLSSLELDVLTFCIIESLSAPDKRQLKTDDGALSMWIIALATFIGALYKKYPSDLTSMLQFIANELKTGKSLDLLILREIVTNMSGIDAYASLTENSIEALTGGEVLKQEIFHTLAVRSSKKLSARLKGALLKDDLLPSLFILMAQQKSCVIFVDSENLPLKLTGQLLDQCRDTFVQFNSFLQFAFKPDECAAILPKADSLIKDYFLPVECAMYFWREIYMRQIEVEWKEGIKKLKGDDQTIDETQSQLVFNQACQNVVQSLEDALCVVNDGNFWSDVSKRLYAIFWLLDLGDLQCPTTLYEKLINKAVVEKNDTHESSSKKRQKEDKFQILERKLRDELSGREQHIQLIKGYLKQQVSSLFSLQVQISPVHRFIQTCIIPRAMFSEADAAFCARFFEILHLQKTQRLQTLLFFDKIFCDSSLIINGLTEKESHSIGKFYEMLLTLSLKWHDSLNVFEEECSTHPLRLRKYEDGEIKDSQMSYEEYRTICFKWHYRLFKTFSHMINDGSYVSKRNALIVMSKILPAYPVVANQYSPLLTAVEKLRDAEKGKRNDLSLLAASYATHLKKRQNQMVPLEDFYNKDKTENGTTTEKPTRKRVTAVEPDAQSVTPVKKPTRSSKR